VVHGKTEELHHVGEDARVVVLLEADVHPDGVVERHLAVELGEPDAEPLRLVHLGGREEPEHVCVEPWLRPSAREIPQERLAVKAAAGLDRLVREPLVERLAAREGVPENVRLAVARDQKGEVAGLPAQASHPERRRHVS